MTANSPQAPAPVPSAAACAEAAAWIARLHSSERTSAVEEGFRHWLTASPEHGAAFEMANDIWTETERWPKPARAIYVRWPGAAIVLSYPRAVLATLAISACALIGTLFYLREPGVVTEVGEQRSVTLEDGTRVSLNTATRIQIDYDESIRRVRLDTGEALFEVVRSPTRPFVVVAGNRHVTALGTAFLVRRDSNDGLAVTLVEGKVSVRDLSSSAVVPSPTEPSLSRSAGPSFSAKRGIQGAPSEAQDSSSPLEPGEARNSSGTGEGGGYSRQEGIFTLAPGERLTFLADGAAPKVDRPVVSQVTAWQRGQVILDHTRLADAIDEMNRYSIVQISIDDPEAAHLEVTGVFRSGDSINFAQAVAETYQLQLVRESRLIRLTR